MKQVVINDINTNYFISKNGELYNGKLNRWVVGSIHNGYKVYYIYVNGKKTTQRSHRLVAKAYIDNPNHYNIVNHKNGDKLDNRVNNLEWVTNQYNIQHAIDNGFRKRSDKTAKIGEDLKNEKWVNIYYPFEINTNYEISNYGRVRNKRTKRIHNGSIGEDGYIRYCLSVENKRYTKFAHRLVFFNFHKLKETETKMVVNHKDGVKTNNILENLELVTLSYNVLHSMYITKTNKKLKKVACYDVDGNFIQSFDSIANACNHYGIKQSYQIIESMKEKWLCKNMQWRYFEDTPLMKINKHSRKKPIIQKDIEGNIIRRFKSIREATIFMGNENDWHKISECIKKKRYSYMGYIWEKVE